MDIKGTLLIAFFTSIVVSLAAFLILHMAFPLAPQRAIVSPVATPVATPVAVGEGMVEVPKVTGLSIDQARQMLTLLGLLFDLQEEREDSAHPSGTVIEQAPLAGSTAPKGTSIRVVVAKGPSLVVVPSLARLERARAEETLKGLGLQAGPPKFEASDSLPPDAVLRTEPGEGEKVGKGSAIVLVLSSGVEVEVPRVTGMGYGGAKRKLEAAGFKANKAGFTRDEDKSPGVVVRQSPSAGDKAPQGSTVDLFVNAT